MDMPSESSDRRERRRSRTRDQILAAALDLFEREGYDATTIEDIAEAADISSRTFFRYFESKLDLVLDHGEGDEVDENATFEDLIGQRPSSEGPMDAVRNMLRERLTDELGADAFKIRQFRVALSTPSIRPALLEHIYDHQDDVAVVLARRAGAPDDDLRARVTAAAAVGALWTAVERWVAEGGDAEALAVKIDETFEIVTSGLN